MEHELEANLSRIKKVIATSSIPQVNRLLNEGWTLLEIQKEDSGHPKRTYETVNYHLGHSDPKADEHQYTRPEDL
jgi:hypothetical protein